MIVSISGTHGAGKTTLIRAIQQDRRSWQVRTEITRSLVPRLGYGSPYDIVERHGIAMYEAAVLGQWSLLEKLADDSDRVHVLDRSPVDNLAYYFIHRQPHEVIHETFLVSLAKIYLDVIDLHLHVPLLPFDVALDSMQLPHTQRPLQTAIRSLYERLEIRVKEISATSVEDRRGQAVTFIEELLASSHEGSSV